MDMYILTEADLKRSELIVRATRLSFVVAVLGIALFGGIVKQFKAADGQITVRSLEEIKTRLLSDNEEDRKALAQGLRLNIPAYTRHQASSDIPCNLFDSVTIIHEILLQPGTQAVVNAYSRSCQYTFLVVLGRTPDGSWRHLDTMPLESFYDEPKITLESLVAVGTKEIIASGVVVDRGTGILRQDMMVLKLFPNGLSVIFDQPERVQFAIPLDSKTGRNSDQAQESTFEFIAPPKEGEPTSIRQILERQVIRDHRLTIKRGWIYTWNPVIERFRGYATSYE
jgi:hypothetical protein